ncbi:MAG TPA: PH domain-containing protein [Candidatus Saccharimonadales bacterium]|nr:PH domain-containing protein [Candidatus Saccharimonadales bacterium]
MADTDSKKSQTDHVKYFEDQFDDETVLFVFRKHPIVMRKGLVFGMLGPLIGIIPTAIHPEWGFGVFFGGLALGCVLGGLIFLPSWIGWHFSVFVLTDQRFIQITQKGLFHRAVADLGLQQIQSVNYEVSGLQETLLGFGTIKMQTYVGDLTIHDVHHPAKIQKKILGILRDQGVNASAYPAGGRPNQMHEETEEVATEA